jgi:hypothetical protein
MVRLLEPHPAALNRSTLLQAMCPGAEAAAVARRQVAVARLEMLWTNGKRLAAICTVVAAHGQGGTPPADLPKPDAPDFLATCAEAVPVEPVTPEDVRAAYVRPRRCGGSSAQANFSSAQIERAMAATLAVVTPDALRAVINDGCTGPELPLADAARRGLSLQSVLSLLVLEDKLAWLPATPNAGELERLIGVIVEWLHGSVQPRPVATPAAPAPATAQKPPKKRTITCEDWVCPHSSHKDQAVYADTRSDNNLCYHHRHSEMPGWTFVPQPSVSVPRGRRWREERRGEWVPNQSA